MIVVFFGNMILGILLTLSGGVMMTEGFMPLLASLNIGFGVIAIYHSIKYLKTGV